MISYVVAQAQPSDPSEKSTEQKPLWTRHHDQVRTYLIESCDLEKVKLLQ